MVQFTTTTTTKSQSTTTTTVLSSSSLRMFLLLSSMSLWKRAEGFVSVSRGVLVHPPPKGALFYSDSSLPVPPPHVDLLSPDKNKNHNNKRRTKHELATTTTTTTTTSRLSEKQAVTTITSMEEFQKQVVLEQESIVVVRFLASWCPGCKATSPAYLRLKHKLQNECSTTSTAIRFVDCPLDEASVPFHEELGIMAIPFVQIYHPTQGLVDQQQISRSNMAAFQKRLVSSLTSPKMTTTTTTTTRP